jgi:hypothetical protein
VHQEECASDYGECDQDQDDAHVALDSAEEGSLLLSGACADEDVLLKRALLLVRDELLGPSIHASSLLGDCA